MSNEKHIKPAPGGSSTGYETRDVNVRSVGTLVAALLGVTALSLLAMGWLFIHLAGRESKEQPQPSSMTALPSGQSEPPEPRLQTSPVQDLKNLRAAEDATLTSYAWVDRKAGVVRIPIDRAIELVSEAGLPVLPAQPGPATAAVPGAVSGNDPETADRTPSSKVAHRKTESDARAAAQVTSKKSPRRNP